MYYLSDDVIEDAGDAFEEDSDRLSDEERILTVSLLYSVTQFIVAKLSLSSSFS